MAYSVEQRLFYKLTDTGETMFICRHEFNQLKELTARVTVSVNAPTSPDIVRW